MSQGRSPATSSGLKVGDVVQVVRYMACGCNLGHIGTVIGFAPIEDDTCNDCSTGSRLSHSGDGVRVKDGGGIARYPREWLMRIPPLSEMEGEREWVYIRSPEDLNV